MQCNVTSFIQATMPFAYLLPARFTVFVSLSERVTRVTKDLYFVPFEPLTQAQTKSLLFWCIAKIHKFPQKNLRLVPDKSLTSHCQSHTSRKLARDYPRRVLDLLRQAWDVFGACLA